MRRVFWLGLGLAAGALVVRKLTRRAEAYTPQGMARSAQQSAAGALHSVRTFVADVRDAMAEREAEIHEVLTEGELIDGEHLADPDHPARRAAGADDGTTIRERP